jgi:hypothetical protein
VNDKNKQTENSNWYQAFEKFLLAFFTIIGITTAMAWTGLKTIKVRSAEFYMLFPSTLFLLFGMSYNDYTYLKWLHKILPKVFNVNVVLLLRTIPREWHYGFLIVFTLYTVGIIFGFTTYIRLRNLQKCLNTIGLSNALGGTAKVIREVAVDENRSKVHIIAKGIGTDRFESKKNDLESALERIIETITMLDDRRTVEILVCKKALILNAFEFSSNT